MRHLALAILAAASLVACASLPRDVERTPSTAFDRPLETRMGQFFDRYAQAHPGLSGFTIIPGSRAAFTTRIGLADVAERSLDLQYYIWENDATGKLLAIKLYDAARRGVHIRILVDDNNLQGRDFSVAALDSHPDIEVRIFNPFANRDSHALDFLSDFGRANHRMHNKVMIADGAVAVIGGRNIGDHYFGVNTEANFRDLDVAAVGPIVAEASASFDTYWNSDWAYPIDALHNKQLDPERIAKLERETRESIHEYPYPIEEDTKQLIDDIGRIADTFVWAKASVIADDPAELTDGRGDVKDALAARIRETKHELLIESAYFVPGSGAIETARQMVARGVNVRVLTNSLASNDVAAAHAGWEKYRADLIRAGAEVYELRPDAGQVRQQWEIMGGRSIAALHTKALVIDRSSTFIGSFNLDPRSANINTEVGLLIDSPAFAAEAAEYLDEGVRPDNAYHVTLDDDGDLRWTAQVDGHTKVFDKEPETSGWKRFVADFIKVMPVESQL
jgi:putative cardiolipin synthase